MDVYFILIACLHLPGSVIGDENIKTICIVIALRNLRMFADSSASHVLHQRVPTRQALFTTYCDPTFLDGIWVVRHIYCDAGGSRA